MLKWGLWDQLDAEALRTAWVDMMKDQRGQSQDAHLFSPLWGLLSLGRQLYLSVVGGMSLLQILDNLFLHAFMLGVYYCQMIDRQNGLDQLTDDNQQGGRNDTDGAL